MYKRHGVWPNGGTKKGQTMVCQRVELYRKRDSPGDPIPINVDPYEVVDGIPEDGGWRDKRQMVKDNLKRGRVLELGVLLRFVWKTLKMASWCRIRGGS